MAKQDETPGRAAGGFKRAVLLSPERRTEIAREAANKRWSNPNLLNVDGTRKKAVSRKMLKGVTRQKEFTVTYTKPGTDNTKVAVISEGSKILRIYNGTEEAVDGIVRSYLDALEDVGIEVTLTINTAGKN